MLKNVNLRAVSITRLIKTDGSQTMKCNFMRQDHRAQQLCLMTRQYSSSEATIRRKVL